MLIDEDSQDKILVAKLKKAGHNVLTVKEATLLSQPDKVVLAYAVEKARVVLTRNCDHFLSEAAALKSSGGHHHGILLVYAKNDPDKDMSYDDIVRAVGNIVKAVGSKELVLNDFEISLSYYLY